MKLDKIFEKHKWDLNGEKENEIATAILDGIGGVNAIHKMHNDEIEELKKEVKFYIAKKLANILNKLTERQNKLIEVVFHDKRNPTVEKLSSIGMLDWVKRMLLKSFPGLVKARKSNERR